MMGPVLAAKIARSVVAAWLLAVAMTAPAAADLPADGAQEPRPLAMTDDNRRDFLCHFYLYNAFTGLKNSKGDADAIRASYASSSYFIGKLVGRNGDDFSVGPQIIDDITKPYDDKERRNDLLRDCLDEYNAVFGKIEEKQGS